MKYTKYEYTELEELSLIKPTKTLLQVSPTEKLKD